MAPKEVRYNDILTKAVEAFHAATGLRLDIKGEQVRLQDGRRAEALLRFRVDDIDEQFVVEVKQPLTTATLGTAVRQLEGLGPHHGMIITDYVNPEMAERLRKLDIAFIDTAGNAYLQVPLRGHPIYVFVKGNKPPRKPAQQTTRRVFHTAGLKVVFAFLCDPALVTAPYREIARKAGVALGTVDRAITDLKELNYVIERGKQGRRLVKRKELLDRWVANYAERLRPKLVLGNFTAPEQGWWQTILDPLGGFDACWGGEVAAARLTRYLKPEVVTIYVRAGATKLQIKHGLRKDPEGKVELLKTFWDRNFDRDDPNLAPALIVYADLLAIGDPRDIETANLIYERELAGLVGEN